MITNSIYSRYFSVRAGDVVSAYRPTTVLHALSAVQLYCSICLFQYFRVFLCSQGEGEMSDGVEPWLLSLFLFSHCS